VKSAVQWGGGDVMPAMAAWTGSAGSNGDMTPPKKKARVNGPSITILVIREFQGVARPIHFWSAVWL
jgi:hypothetical protein